jgi:rhamnulokinase
MATTCIAVDIGASSGRLIAGTIENGKLNIAELHRFKNGMTSEEGHAYWDLERLFQEIEIGLKKVYEVYEDVTSIGVDTWGVDYTLLDGQGERIQKVYAYRDHRTDFTMEEVFVEMDRNEIYKKTGVQFLQFNTLYQLKEHYKMHPEDVENAKIYMMVPDYLHYKLSGKVSVEYTNATTTQMLNVHTNTWDTDLIKVTGFDKSIFREPTPPGTKIGQVKPEILQKIGFASMDVVVPATHDTGSAVAAVPAIDKEFAYISSGTWSLMGVESDVPIASELAGRYNFANEGGVCNTYRVLKNIMGLWLIQEVQRVYDYKYSFAEMVELAKASERFMCLIYPNHERFLNPVNMIEEIQKFCMETDQTVPMTPGQISRCIFESLAFQYKEVLIQLREIYDVPIKRIHIIGGGSKNLFLNQLCADFTECDVYAGPDEATAIGNLLMQFITNGALDSLVVARQLVMASFDIKKFEPTNQVEINEQWHKFRRLGHAK